MEPVVKRREHGLIPALEDPVGDAAVEPAVEQREHAGVVAVGADLDLAAMEPAVGGGNVGSSTPERFSCPRRNGVHR